MCSPGYRWLLLNLMPGLLCLLPSTLLHGCVACCGVVSHVYLSRPCGRVKLLEITVSHFYSHVALCFAFLSRRSANIFRVMCVSAVFVLFILLFCCASVHCFLYSYAGIWLALPPLILLLTIIHPSSNMIGCIRLWWWTFGDQLSFLTLKSALIS